jgi:predicted ATPase
MTLDGRFPEIVTGQAKHDGRQCTEAGVIDATIECRAKAGERGMRASAYKEAVAHLTRAIGLAEELADSPVQRFVRLRLRERLRLRTALRPRTDRSYTLARLRPEWKTL